MTSRDFAYWLQGFFEISGAEWTQTQPLDAIKVDVIKKHLHMVFVHEIDPSMGDKQHQTKLNAIHDAGGGPIPGTDFLVRC
jgi:hypothetical protein